MALYTASRSKSVYRHGTHHLQGRPDPLEEGPCNAITNICDKSFPDPFPKGPAAGYLITALEKKNNQTFRGILDIYINVMKIIYIIFYIYVYLLCSFAIRKLVHKPFTEKPES